MSTGRPWVPPGPPPGRDLGRLTQRQRARRAWGRVWLGVAGVLAAVAFWGLTGGVVALTVVLGVWASAVVLRRVGMENRDQDVFRIVTREGKWR